MLSQLLLSFIKFCPSFIYQTMWNTNSTLTIHFSNIIYEQMSKGSIQKEKAIKFWNLPSLRQCLDA